MKLYSNAAFWGKPFQLPENYNPINDLGDLANVGEDD
jgi:hypothetical protein